MRSRASLVIIEQVVMLLVFALAAALCLKAFVWADTESANIMAQDKALLQAQSAAEVLKSSCGDMSGAAEIMGGSVEGGCWTIKYDEKWQQTVSEGDYILVVSPAEESLQYMSAAEVCVYENESLLTSLKIAWQEVDENE